MVFVGGANEFEDVGHESVASFLIVCFGGYEYHQLCFFRARRWFLVCDSGGYDEFYDLRISLV